MSKNLQFQAKLPLIGLNFLLISGIARTSLVQLEYLTDKRPDVVQNLGDGHQHTMAQDNTAPYPGQIRLTR